MPNPRDPDTARRILEAARKVFLEKGMAGARMQQIADEAGINKALLHYYFRSKEQLFRQVFEEALADMMPNVHAAVLQPMPIRDKLKTFVRVYFEQVRAHPVVPLFVLHELQRGGAALVDIFAEQMKQAAPQAPRLIPRILLDELRAAAARGELGAHQPEHLLVSLMAMCVFPFVARPMIQFLMGMDETAFERFLDARVSQVELFLECIFPERGAHHA